VTPTNPTGPSLIIKSEHGPEMPRRSHDETEVDIILTLDGNSTRVLAGAAGGSIGKILVKIIKVIVFWDQLKSN
jgi:hypothetical protein